MQVKWPNDIVVAEAGDLPREAAQATGEGSPCGNGSALLRGAASHGAVCDGAAPGGEFPAGDSRFRHPFHTLCGISTEMHARALCVGVGVNVARPADAASVPAGKNVPVYLDELGFCEGPVEDRINAVADALCDQLAIAYPLWCEQGFEPFQAEFDGCSALSGRFVRMEDLSGNVLAAGTVTRVAPDGRLVLRTLEGVEVFASSGEAHIR